MYRILQKINYAVHFIMMCSLLLFADACSNENENASDMNSQFPFCSVTDVGSQADETVYAMVNKCFTIKSTFTGQYLAPRYHFGYKYRPNGTSNEAAKFYLQAAGLGSFLLYDQNKDFIVADGGSDVGRWNEVGDNAEWEIIHISDDTFALRSVTEGTYLGVIEDWFGSHLEVRDTYSEDDAFVFTTSNSCTSFPESEVNAEVEVTTRSSDSAVWGFADVHNHLFSNEGFGGLLFQGEAFSKLGISEALKDCSYAHGSGGVTDNIGNIMDNRLGHYTDGYPTFTGWPRRDLSNHQQMYYKWVKRAYLGGLRLLVTHAVTNKLLCEYANVKDGCNCNDMDAVDLQLAKVKALEAYIDAQNGGPGKGWFRIVYSPEEARTVINQGKLAVVLGIEVDQIFDCTPGNCSEEHIREQLDIYYAKGVRSIFPIHMFDNDLGGASLQLEGLQNTGNKIINDFYMDIYDCSEQGYEYQESNDLPSIWATLFGESYSPHEEADGHCNCRPLSDTGELFIREMMKRKMIIEVDHMDAVTIDRTLDIVEEVGYPVISAHTGIFDLQKGQGKHEGQKTAEQIARIRALGGVVAPILMQGVPATYKCDNPVSMDCDESSKAWAQAYLYLVDKMGGNAVPIGSDFNGMIHQPAPRFGTEACLSNTNQAILQENPVVYPFSAHGETGLFNKLQTIDRTWDYNTDGLAHIGLLPDFIQDLKNIGLTDEQLEPLFNSAEAYIRMWEKIEATSL